MKGKPEEQAQCCGPRGELIEGLTSEEKTGKRDWRVDMFWQNSKTPPRLAASSAALSLFVRLWTRAFINNLFINMPGNTGGRWSEEEG